MSRWQLSVFTSVAARGSSFPDGDEAVADVLRFKRGAASLVIDWMGQWARAYNTKEAMSAAPHARYDGYHGHCVRDAYGVLTVLSTTCVCLPGAVHPKTRTSSATRV